ncbi:MAG: leucine-rich repeat protein [Clostridia bacterium]|nr:leucine-rich repeat protein [Clostridia bacterium]
MKKRIAVVSLLAVIALIFQFSAVPSFALEDGMYEYTVKDGFAVITRYLGSGASAVNIPYSLGGYPVSGIGDNAFGEIGTDGVKPHKEILEVTIPDTVDYIGDRALSGTAWIDSSAAADSKGFVVINGMLINYIGASEQAVIPQNVDRVNIAAFEKKDISSVVIPDSVTVVDDFAFYKCTKLKSVEFGDGVKEIGKKAFYGCTALSSLNGEGESVMYPTLETIGANAFFDCKALSGTIDLGTGLKSIGANAFANCDQLDGVRVPDTLESIGSYALGFRMVKKNSGYEPSQNTKFTVYVTHTEQESEEAEQEVLAGYSKAKTAIYKYTQNPDGNGFFAAVRLVWDHLAYPFLYGDANNDGKVNSADARTVLRHAASLEKLENENDLLASDVNSDGKVNSKDARMILRASAKIEPLPLADLLPAEAGVTSAD